MKRFLGVKTKFQNSVRFLVFTLFRKTLAKRTTFRWQFRAFLPDPKFFLALLFFVMSVDPVFFDISGVAVRFEDARQTNILESLEDFVPLFFTNLNAMIVLMFV